MTLSDQEVEALREIVSVFRKLGGYESDERRAVINRILEAT